MWSEADEKGNGLPTDDFSAGRPRPYDPRRTRKAARLNDLQVSMFIFP
jgi:hypothetical protein